jgi:hypothetical protein
MPQQRATSANNGLPQRIGTSPRLVYDTFRFVTSIAEQSRAKSFGHAERRQALTLCAISPQRALALRAAHRAQQRNWKRIQEENNEVRRMGQR